MQSIYEEKDTAADGSTVEARRDAPWRGVRSEATEYASTTVGAGGAKSADERIVSQVFDALRYNDLDTHTLLTQAAYVLHRLPLDRPGAQSLRRARMVFGMSAPLVS